MALVWITLAGCSREIVDQGPSDRYRAALSGDCSEDFIVVFARGSGQPPDISGQPETRRFFQALDEVFRTTVRIGHVSVAYPALGGLAQNLEAYRNGASSGRYHDSRQAGTDAAAALLNERSARCDAAERAEGTGGHRQRFILGGYSQGAHAMREALFRLDARTRARVSYVALFGDPTFLDGEPTAKGSRAGGAQGLFGGARPQVPPELASLTDSYCDGEDFLCGGGPQASGMLKGQAEDWVKQALGRRPQHALYPFDEMYRAAAENLKRRHLPQLRPRLDTRPGRFAGRYEGTAACDWTGEVGQSDPRLLLYLTLDVAGADTTDHGTAATEHLTASLTYEDTSSPTRRLLGRAQLSGTGAPGKVELRHERWTEGGTGLQPLDIAASATQVVLGDGPVAGAEKVSSLATPLQGHAGCFYRLNRVGGGADG